MEADPERPLAGGHSTVLAVVWLIACLGIGGGCLTPIVTAQTPTMADTAAPGGEVSKTETPTMGTSSSTLTEPLVPPLLSPWAGDPPAPAPAPAPESPVLETGKLVPQLIRANLVPGLVDISQGNRNVMAIAEVELSSAVRGVMFRLRPRDLLEPPMLQAAGNLISATARTGRWEALVSIPPGCRPGRWSLSVVIQTTDGDAAEYGPFGELPLPATGTKELMVVNQATVDLSIPEIEVLKVEPQLALVGCGEISTPIRIRLRIKSPTGLGESDSSFVELRRPDLQTSMGGDGLGEMNRIGGSAVDGIYEAVVSVHPDSKPGEFSAGAVVRSRVGWKGRMLRAGPKVEVRSLKDLPRGYMEWAAKNFPAEFPDPACEFQKIWRPDADTDGDGVINCVEAYFGTSPTNRADAPKIQVSYDSRRQFVVNWIQPQNTYGLVVQPEWSSDLDLWFASGESLQGMKARTISVSDEGPAPKGGQFKEARFEMNGLPHAYLRLRVLMP